jgi:hypothetical protein
VTKTARPKLRVLVDWTAEWQELYALGLPRLEHEAARDELLNGARAAGEIKGCLEGQARSVSFHDDLPWIA